MTRDGAVAGDYIGRRGGGLDGARVYRVWDDDTRAHTLDPRHDLWKHSEGFEWSYSGSGPAQLALALVSDALGREADEDAVRVHQRFKSLVVARLPKDVWRLPAAEVAELARALVRREDDRVARKIADAMIARCLLNAMEDARA